MIKGAPGQALHIGWACRDRWSPVLVEEFMTIIFHREVTRDDLLGKLQRLSSPPGGGLHHVAPVQRDLVMESALEAYDRVGPELISYVDSEYEELRLLMLTDSRLFELEVSFPDWSPPLEGEEVIELEEGETDPATAASGKGAAAMVQQSGGGSESGPSPDEICQLRVGIRTRTGMAQEDRVCGPVLDCPQGPIPVTAMSKRSFYPEARPRMELNFEGGGYSDVTAVLFDETSKEEWRRALSSKFDPADWELS